MKYTFLILLLCSIHSLNAQYYVSLDTPKEMKIPDRVYYIQQVVDERQERDNIGFVYQGLNNQKKLAFFEGGLEPALQNYFDHALPFTGSEIGLKLIIEGFNISEVTTFKNENAYLFIKASFYFKEKHLDTKFIDIESQGMDVTADHSENIHEALQQLINEFDGSKWREQLLLESIDQPRPDQEIVSQSQPGNTNKSDKPLYKPVDKPDEKPNRDRMAVGYQVGGLSLIGFNYTARVSDKFGVHAGFGLLGITLGAKYFFNEKATSTFINASFKDGGFGLMQLACIEIGGTLFNKKDDGFGLFYQVGLGTTIKIDESFKQDLFGNDPVPPAILSFGAGISF